MDLSGAAARVKSIRKDTVAAKSRGIYILSNARFLAWLFENKPHLLTDSTLAALEQEQTQQRTRLTSKEVVKILKELLDDNHPGQDHPLKFDELTVTDFMTWIVTLKKKDGSEPCYSTNNSHRAALFNLFRDSGVHMARDFELELQNHFKGLKRQTAVAVTAGEAKCRTGKDPMPFGLYSILAMEMLKSTTREHMFARTFLILCWNLMSRAGNAFSICFDHMQFLDDALLIFFAHMKNDQMGERPRDPRHIYANPIIPAVCPLLALGVYWLCYPPQSNQKNLFPGNSQYDRFRKILSKFLKENDIVGSELRRRGIDPDDIGSHSIRKGSATFVSSGSTACPSSTAVHLRAGWAMGGVQDTYLRYEGAGDMYVGRSVCGLPVGKPEFALLPPRFKGCSNQDIEEAIKLCFPGLPPSMAYIAEHALASVLYHKDFLLRTVPADHPLMSTIPFRPDVQVIQHLREHVVCTYSDPEDSLYASGIPPHVDMALKLERLMAKVEALPDQVTQGVIKVLEDRAIGAGTVTTDGLKETLSTCIREAISEHQPATFIQRSHQQPAAPTTAPLAQNHRRDDESAGESMMVVSDDEESGGDGEVTEGGSGGGGGSYPVPRKLFSWGGRLHPFPRDFKLPKGSVQQAWILWNCGDPQKGYPPLKTLHPSDLEQKNSKKRLCDFKYIMKLVEARAKELGLWKSKLTVTEAVETFRACQDAVDVGEISDEHSRTRRKSQMSWLSVATLMRKEMKRRKEGGGGGGEG